MEKNKYGLTIKAAFIGYMVQAVVNNYLPLLFIQMQGEFGISLSRITLLITVNFLIQLLIDLTSAPVIAVIGYRAAMLISNGTVIAGLVLLTILPGMFTDPYIGILMSVCVYAIGGGLQEVLVSPIVEACPTDHKESAMSLLHSFYCWGHVGVVLLSTVFFRFAGISHWRLLALHLQHCLSRHQKRRDIDVCPAGPGLAGLVSTLTAGQMRAGIGAAAIFPLLMSLSHHKVKNQTV